METPVISERFSSTCQVVYANHSTTAGGLNRESLAYLTPDQVQSLFAPGGLWAEMDAAFKAAFEMKACGVRKNTLYDWLYSNKRGGRKVQIIDQADGTPSLLQPFVYGKQESVINTEHWQVDDGWANSDYTAVSTGPLTTADLALGEATDRVIRVRSADDIKTSNLWFNPGMRVFIFTRTAGVAGVGQWEVIARATPVDSSYTDVLVKDMNGGTDQEYEAEPTGSALLTLSNNNVDDVEKWCHNMQNYSGTKMVPIWIKTFRRSMEVSSLYEETYARLMESGTNEAFKLFGEMPMAKRNAQNEQTHQNQWVWNFLFSVPSDANQTNALWQNLDRIESPSGYAIDPGTGGELIAYRAENVGVREQLRRCNRVRDLLGETLNFYEFLAENYAMSRARRSSGRNADVIEWYTDSVFAAQFHRAWIAYWKKETNDTLVMNHDLTKSNEMGMKYKEYSNFIFPAGVTIRIIVDPFFDDFRNEMKNQGMEQLGTILTALDLGKGGSIYWLQTGSNKKTYRTGEVDKLAQIDSNWACVMKNPTISRTLISESGGVVVECPMENLWIWNIGRAIPITTGEVTTGESPYYHDLI